MDLSDIWQENKRFIITVGSGLLVFFIGLMVIDGLYLGDIKQATRQNSKTRSELRKELYSVDDRAVAQDENAALAASYERVATATAFAPRDEFVLGATGDSPQNQYFTAVERVRTRVGDFASRRRAFLPDGLDLEMLNTRNVDAIERRLHALDLLERALVMAIDSGVRQVRSIEVSLDPAFERRRGLSAIEKTRIDIEVSSEPESVTRWIAMTETPGAGGLDSAAMSENAAAAIRTQALPIQALQIQSQKSKDGQIRAKVTFLVVRIHELASDDDQDV